MENQTNFNNQPKKIVMKAKSLKFTIKMGNASARLESGYLIISNKKKCGNLIKNSKLSGNDIVDALISLHIVLEVGLNTLYRHLITSVIKKQIDEFEIIENIDKINFIDKTVLFIYNSKFNFGDNLDKANEFHKIIGEMRCFSEARNKLLHGHSISTIFCGEKNKHSKTKRMLSPDYLGEQVKRFCSIMKGMRFYLDCLDSELSSEGKESFKNSYLDDSFLPVLRT